MTITSSPDKNFREDNSHRKDYHSKHSFLHYAAHLFILFGVIAFAIVTWFYPASTLGNTVQGIGFLLPESCALEFDQNLKNTTGINQAASAAATTIMTLLPALLTFSPFPIAGISSLLVFSTSVTILTSGITLGLSVPEISTLAKDRIIRVKDLCTEAAILAYGSDNGSQQPQRLSEPGGHGAATAPIIPVPAHERSNLHADAISALRQPYSPGTSLQHLDRADTVPGHGPTKPEPEIRDKLRELMKRVSDEDNRPKRLYVSGMVFAFLYMQASLFFLLVTYTPTIDTISIIWICSNSTVSYYVVFIWMGVAALFAGIFRTLAESSIMGKHEILHLSPLPQSPTISAHLAECENCSVTEPPPSRRTGPGSFLVWYFRYIYSIVQIRTWYKLLQYPSTARLIFSLFLKGQLSRHAMIVILRPTEEMNPPGTWTPLFDVLCGYLQAIMLIFLTFIFGSTYSGDLFYTLVFVVVFTTLMVISRTYSIYFCWWMEKALDVTIIEYDTHEELKAIRIMLTRIPGTLVESTTEHYKYLAGYKFNDNECHNLSTTGVNPRTIGCLICIVIILCIIAVASVFGRFGCNLWSYKCDGTPMAPSNLLLDGSTLVLIYLILNGCFLCKMVIRGFDSISTHDISITNHNAGTLDPELIRTQFAAENQ